MVHGQWSLENDKVTEVPDIRHNVVEQDISK